MVEPPFWTNPCQGTLIVLRRDDAGLRSGMPRALVGLRFQFVSPRQNAPSVAAARLAPITGVSQLAYVAVMWLSSR